MADFESGVFSYIHARAVVDVCFPVDRKGNADVSCNQCPYFRRSSRSCALNDRMCAYPEKFVGRDCPLKRVE